MPSTLHAFRKHQKILMVMTTGLAMISFLILGAVNSRPENMPAVLVVAALAAMFGGAAWVIGQVNGKSSEYLTTGAVAGAVLGLWLSWGRAEPNAILMDSGDLTTTEVFNMKRERNLANQFVGDAYQRVNGFQANFAEQFGQRVFFRYTPGQYDSDVEIAITKLLQREADRLGIDVSTAAVFDFIRGLAMTSGKALTQQQFAEIRSRLGVSEEQLIKVLADELKARRAYDLLYSQRPLPTPEALYDYYSKLNLQQEAEIAVVPVADFVDDKAEPSAKDLDELFVKYKANPPGYGPDGKFVEGMPGFRQPPRMKLAYLEAVYDTFEKQVGEVTDKEIEDRYEQLKKRPFGDSFDMPDFSGDLPAIPPGGLMNPLDGILPNSLTPPTPPPAAADSTPPAAPAEGTAPESSPAATPPAPEASAPEASTPDAPKGDAAPPAAPPASPSEGTPPAATPDATSDSTPPAVPADNPSSSMLPNLSTLSFVAFQDDQPPPPPVASGENATAAATTETPAQPETPPAEGTPSTPALPPPAPPTLEGATPPADPPLPTVRPLDDAYRAEIKEEIIRERTQALMEKKIDEAVQWFASEIGARINTPAEEQGHLTAEDAAKKLKEYAGKNGLVYVETPFLSFQELQNSEDYPVGAAAAVNHPEKANVATDAFESFGRSMFYLPRPAASLDQSGEGSWFVYWLTAERRDGEPANMDDPIVKQQVVKTWRELKAREKAEARAAALVKLAQESDKPLTELFAEQSVTGESGTGYISVRPTGKFTWYRMPVVPTRSMQREASPTLTELPGLKPVGDSFFSTVFEKLKVGETGTANSMDKSEYYVVKVTNRTPSTPEELETFRQTFLARGLSNEYFDLASRDWALYGRNPIDDLLKRNNVQFVNRGERDAPPEG